MELIFPGLDEMVLEDGLSAPTPAVFWFDEATPGSCSSPLIFPPFCEQAEAGYCGVAGAGGKFAADHGETFVSIADVSCTSSLSLSQVYSLRAVVCPTGCRSDATYANLVVGGPPLYRALGCLDPPKSSCCEANQCKECPAGESGGSVGGQGPCLLADGGGPGANLRYRAGGVGNDPFPGSVAWSVALGRNWAHDYAERIVLDPSAGNDSHVWLLTKSGTFREFKDLAGGDYTTTSPSDEKRTLHRITGNGWRLDSLDGSSQYFNEQGLWTLTEDRNGNQKVAHYTLGQLTSVDLPDQRHEQFFYDASGKLVTIREVGIGGTSFLEWTYVWTGNDLTRINRPDGTALRFEYAVPFLPGFMTRMVLVGTDATERTQRGWEYDSFGNVTKTWEGAATFAAASAGKWQWSYDDALAPAVTTVTDPHGEVAVYGVDREPGSEKPRATSISGGCPACGYDPDTSFIYGDSTNGFLPTTVIEGTDGTPRITELTYDANGMLTYKSEAAGTPQERHTGWLYGETNFPTFVTEVQGPTPGDPALSSRKLSLDYEDTLGDLIWRRVNGNESTYPSGTFALTTNFTGYNAAGLPASIDPPSFGNADATTFTYDSSRGGLFVATRTAPDPSVPGGLVTSFSYDPYNRQIQSSLNRRAGGNDPTRHYTCYDALDRITRTLVTGVNRDADACTVLPGSLGPDELLTRLFYSKFGDLFCTVLPRGNAIERAYDSAGRLLSITRGTAVASPSSSACLNSALPREQKSYVLDGVGNRTHVDLRTAPGGAGFSTQSFVDHHYASRCQLDKTTYADGSATEYKYDCNGHLEKLWDPNHPSSNQSNPPTATYTYDSLDRPTTLTQPFAGGGNTVTSYIYDAQDHVTRVVDAEGNQTDYTWSDRDLLTSQTSPAWGPNPATRGMATYSYTDHGKPFTETDARGIVTTRVVDAADHVTSISYSDGTPTVSFAFSDAGSCPLPAYPKGRLSLITRNSQTLPYCYDRFGRLTRDGDLAFGYDQNGNRTSIGYPKTVLGFEDLVAVYGFDFADRETSLSVQEGSRTSRVVDGASYRAFGPLATLSLGNGPPLVQGYSGLIEARSFDSRNDLDLLHVARGSRILLDWDYSFDDAGNLTSIADTLNATQSRYFAYTDFQYFLKCAAGPWNPPGAQCSPAMTGQPLQWSDDKVGNRLTEYRQGSTDTYSYLLNSSGGHGPRLNQISGASGLRTFSYDLAGNETFIDGVNDLKLEYGGDSRLKRIAPGNVGAPQTLLTHDGRSLLTRSQLDLDLITNPAAAIAEPTYGSDGRLYATYWKRVQPFAANLESDDYVLYFAGRPVQLVHRTLPVTGSSFGDVPRTSAFWVAVEQLKSYGVSAGCSALEFCPSDPITRAQLAMFLLRAEHGSGYVPPACTSATFSDVPCGHPYAAWIYRLAAEGISSGCGGGSYCPDDAVRRDQLAQLLLRAVDGSTYTPPACTGTFSDVPCTSMFAPAVEELAERGLSAGCGGGNYCPEAPVTREELALLVDRTFELGRQYLASDHLGTPVLATNRAAWPVWQGGLEPFGGDYSGAQGQNIFLRFAGQWQDVSWDNASVNGAADLFYNVNRWYDSGVGRYTTVDPVSFVRTYDYAGSRPTMSTDPLGLYIIDLNQGPTQLRFGSPQFDPDYVDALPTCACCGPGRNEWCALFHVPVSYHFNLPPEPKQCTVRHEMAHLDILLDWIRPSADEFLAPAENRPYPTKSDCDSVAAQARTDFLSDLDGRQLSLTMQQGYTPIIGYDWRHFWPDIPCQLFGD